MSGKLLALNVVGLTPAHIGAHTPNLKRLAAQGESTHIRSMLPGVTCSVQTTYFTGVMPAQHGIVGNGWYLRDLCEIKFWHQSNRLIQPEAEQIWTALRQRDPAARSANIFCWYNMYCPADIAITVRPLYPADGRKIPDIYTSPPAIRQQLNKTLGQFPLFNFWGPNSNIVSSRWIADAALRTLEESRPDLAIVYLPHLDYAMQKQGPDHASITIELQRIDALCGDLIDYARAHDYTVVVLSEYGIEKVSRVCHLNRLFRQQGWLTIKDELGLELLDPEASRVFAVADHQIAHIYVQDKSLLPAVSRLLEQQPEIETVLNEQGKKNSGLAHNRSGELVAVAKSDAWFSYYYWLEDARAPDFARTVDIHRKPGYDPVELFVDPGLRFPVASIAWRLLKKKLGFRMLMDVIPLDANLVKGSHGALSKNPQSGPLYICSATGVLSEQQRREGLAPTEIKNLLLDLVRPA
jgi:predicted AlkP superfamily pyrophosphatase or phosphodiesterase